MEQPTEQLIRIKCVKEGSKLRIKITSPGYSSDANCQFPKDIRIAGREFLVPKSDISLVNTRGKFFYRIKKNNITICGNKPEIGIDLSKLKIYGDENLAECSICMNDVESKSDIVFIIIAPCGHYCCCKDCVKQLKQCPMCRANIEQIVTKDQLQ
jgi:hypothetical protein